MIFEAPQIPFFIEEKITEIYIDDLVYFREEEDLLLSVWSDENIEEFSEEN